MKKNIKIASVTAAALLAVAPVVATGTANAAVTVNNAAATQPAQPTQTAGTVTVNISLDATAGKTTVAEALKTAKVSVDGATVANAATGTGAYKVEIAKAGTTTALSDSTKLEANQAYVILVNGIKLKGLTTGNTYSIAGGTVAGKTTQTAEQLNSDAGVNFTSDSFYVFDKSLEGSPVVTEGNHIVSSGSLALGDNTTVEKLAQAITKKYSVKMTHSGDNYAKALDWSASAVENSVRSSLKNANVTVDNDGSFKAPATNFTVNLTGYASNGKTVSFPVTVTVSNSTTNTASDAPVFSTTNNDYKAVANSTNTWNLSLGLNSATNAQAIANAFTAKINSTSDLTTNVKVDSSNLNTAVAGKYTVVLSATNPAGKTTKATVNVTVGDPGETKTVQAGSETAKVVTIDGNKVSETTTTLENGSKVATYGTVTVDGVSYTRLNSSSSNQYVATKYVDGSIKEEKTSEKTIMHVAYVYQKDGKSKVTTGVAKINAYDKVTVYGDIVTLNGAKFYKIGENRYVKVGNIDGTKRTLKHNAYIYNNKLKRVQKNTVLKKGTEKTTYGSAFTIKGKKVYRIAENQYVKVANFK